MIIVRIVGGLGNQMFQYAFAKALQQKGFNVKIDTSKFKTYTLHGGYHLDKYNIDLKTSGFFPTLFSILKIRKNVKEKSLLFDENLTKLQGNEYVKGYFQTEKYFENIRGVLLEQFTLNAHLSDSTNTYVEAIKKQSNTCALHVRRGDFISDLKANSVHGTCDLEYYKKAIKFIKKTQDQLKFYVFSDDIDWAKENLEISNATFIDHKCKPHEDLFLMSLCNHNITANSSFSWWGAWLNKNKNKTVIAPKKWFVNKVNEVACKNWIKI